MAFQNNPNATATVTVTTPVLVAPARTETVYKCGFEDYKETTTAAFTAYSQEFETAPTGWRAFQTGSGSWSITNNGFQGNAYTLNTPNAGHTSFRPPGLSVSLRGLLVGRVYTIFAFGRNRSGIPLGFAVSASGQTPDHYKLTSTMWTRIERTFTATAASMDLYVSVGPWDGDSSTTAPVLFDLDSFSLVRNAYTTVTNTGLDGWSNGSVVSTQKRSGTYSLYANAPAKAFTGLVVGHQYTLRGWYLNGSTWTQWSETFTAASTAQSKTLNLTGLRYWDDVELIHHIPAVYTNTAVLKLTEGDVTIDSGRYPYVEANVEVPFTGEELLEQLAVNQRVTINATEGTTSTQLNLALRDRTVSHDGKRITLKLASDEALLETWADIVDDKGPRAFENNLRNLVQYVIGKAIPGAVLQSGTANADVTARWNAQNSVLNPDAINTGAAYTTAGNVTMFYSNAAGVGQGGSTGYVYGASAAAGQAFIAVPQSVSTRKGDLWTFSAYMHKSSTVAPAVNGILRVYEMDSNGAVMRQIESTPKALVASGTGTPYNWDRHSVTFTVQNPNTTKLALYASMMATAAGQNFGVDSVMLSEGPVLLPYFSGATVPAGYVTNWSGQNAPVPHNSVSERRPADGIERLPELFTWEAGVSAWDFLKPLVASAGLRLYCDEQRRWYLIDPATHVVPGRFSARPDNTVEGTDTIDADDDETGYTGVVAYFRWTDPDGVSRMEKDAAGVAGKVKVLEFTSPYTGPGVAAAHLTKITGQNRTQDVTVRTDYTVRPGQEVQIDLPGTFAQLGTVSKVRWELTNGLMSIGSSQLRETPPGSIDLLTPTIDALPGTIDGLT